jgi:DNA-binding LacI/PurR family transcriptional regulator
MNIRAVAQAARVSVSTVSRAMNYKPTVNPAIAQRVWKTARELNYLPNQQARALVSGHSRLIGIVIPERTDPFFIELIRAFEEVAIDSGFEILVASVSNDSERIARCMGRITASHVEAVAVMTFDAEEAFTDRLRDLAVPAVFVDTAPEFAGATAVRIDYDNGAGQALQHLAALGHRDIAFISGPLRLPSAASRLIAFRKAAQEFGIHVGAEQIIESDPAMRAGIAGAEKLLARGRLPTAIVCSSETCAIGALYRLSQACIRVPDNVSVIGFDGSCMGDMTFPSLTSVQVPPLGLARAAVSALCGFLERRSPSIERVGTHLVVRQSTTVPRAR